MWLLLVLGWRARLAMEGRSGLFHVCVGMRRAEEPVDVANLCPFD